MFKIAIFTLLMSMLVFEISPTDLEYYLYELADQLEPLIQIGMEIWYQLNQENYV